jgi:ABC-type sugar transport system substrate-binding protein
MHRKVEDTPMRRVRLLAVALGIAVLALVVSACGSSNSSSSSSSSSGSSAASNASGPPNVVNASWGTFHLKPSIAAKIKAGEAINYLNSFEASGTPSFGPQWTAGFHSGCEQGTAIYKLNCELVAPVKTNINEQISQVQAKIAAGQVDCLSIQPPTETAINALVNETMAKGIPVFTVGEENHANQLMNFTQHHETEGEVAAETVVAWMKEHHKNFTVFAMSSGLPTLGWAQGRMRGFRKGILKQIPNAKFINTEKNAAEVALEPGPGYDAAKSFISAHPEVQVFMNTDISGEELDKAISDTGNKGKIYSIGWNPSPGQLKGIEQGLQIATVDQRWFDQAAYGGPACATFLKTGKILPNTQKPNPITLAKVSQERKALEEIEKTKA